MFVRVVGLSVACGVILWVQVAVAQEGPQAADLPGIMDSERSEEGEGPDMSAPAADTLPTTAEGQAPAKPAEEKPKPSTPEERLKQEVDLSFTNADLRGVLSGMGKTYGLNIVFDQTVKGVVSINLRDVPLEQALKQILRLSGYTFLWEERILRVVSYEEGVITEVLPLNFIQAEVAMEFLKKEASDSGVMKEDEVQGGILVSDTISKVEEMKKILKQIDQPPQQVLIQARLLDITHIDQDNLGLKLSSVSFDVPLRLSSGIKQVLNIASGSIDVSGPSADLTTDTAAATISKGSETLTATLDALIRNKRVKVLASPTVSTLNNVEAKITIGEKFPITETTQTTTGTLQTTRFVDIGITLRVTPKINRAGFIQMQIHPEVSSVSSTITAGPRITTREADTTIIIKDRESVIIAGLIKEEETMTRDRIPLLGHIPVVGVLFSNRAKSYEQKELVIVITPYLMSVLPPQTVVGSEIQQVEDRMGAVELFRQAGDFEQGRSFQSRDLAEVVRILRAVELYEDVGKRFPTHTFAPTALWKAGELSLQHLQDSSRAERIFSQLAAEFPGHPMSRQASRRVKEIQDRRARQMRKREGVSAKGKSARQGATTNFGFR